MSGGYYRDRMDSEPIEWPPPAKKARKAALTVAAVTGDAEACAEVLEVLGLREVLG